MSYTAPTKKAIVKPKLDTKYEFKDGGKKTVIADANKTTSLGTYIPGIYSVDAKKKQNMESLVVNLNLTLDMERVTQLK